MPKKSVKRKHLKEMDHLKRKMRKLEKEFRKRHDDSSDESSSSSTSDDTSSASLPSTTRSESPEPLTALGNAMGADPTNNSLFGPNIPDEVVVRWKSYLSMGVDKEMKSNLLEKYKIPENCQILQGPKLNPEVQALLSPIEQKKDNFLLELQTVMGKGLTALEIVLTRLAKEKGEGDNGEPNENLLGLAESAQLFCIAHNIVSAHRKFQINHHFNPKTRKLAAAQPIDLLLFGIDFAEKCKNAKVLETTAKELQATASTSKNSTAVASKKRWKPTTTWQDKGVGRYEGKYKPRYYRARNKPQSKHYKKEGRK
ncbi:unnamed protein product [Callosobruchus maculatus]|uniref:Uncharacterized protein n=1 Tax=Callosobruchus maculatus TaxID=64391 RepID=A0A653DQN1_CALMS|nr:unnamed protein product [Callosobruchus maculatus]